MSEVSNIVNITPEFDGSYDDHKKLEELYFLEYKKSGNLGEAISKVVYSDIGQRYFDTRGEEDPDPGYNPSREDLKIGGENYNWLEDEFDERIRKINLTHRQRIIEAKSVVARCRTALDSAEDELRQLTEGASAAISGMEG